jgi:hypothetical protein
MIITACTDEASELERKLRQALAAERKADRHGAQAFAQACREGDVALLLRAAEFLNDNTIDGWRLAMREVGRLSAVSLEVQGAFLPIWIEAKHLPLCVGHRPTMAKALHVLMPPTGTGAPLHLFRGTTALERQRRLYGFSWTTDREIARRFAEGSQAAPDGSVILEATVPPEAIHLRRENEGYYDEREVVVDPYKIGRVTVRERMPHIDPTERQPHQ